MTEDQNERNRIMRQLRCVPLDRAAEHKAWNAVGAAIRTPAMWKRQTIEVFLWILKFIGATLAISIVVLELLHWTIGEDVGSLSRLVFICGALLTMVATPFISGLWPTSPFTRIWHETYDLYTRQR